MRLGRVINNKEMVKTEVWTVVGTWFFSMMCWDFLLCVEGHQSPLLTKRSNASKATNLLPSKRFTVQPDWEVTIPVVGMHKYCPRSDCPQGFDKVIVQ